MGWWKKRTYFLSCISRLISCIFPSQTFESCTVGKCTFLGCWKTPLELKNVRHAASTNRKWKNFWKSVSSLPCVWFDLCLAFRERLFLKLIFKYWQVFLTCFQHWHRHAKPFLTPRKKNCIVIKFLLAAIATLVIRQ